ncbi:MAG: YeeE/YedE thiosulfate transporter family protein [Polyangiaceae bacterium]
MTLSSLLLSLVGGALIGLSATMLLHWYGRIAGISGILGGVLRMTKRDTAWRLYFLGGLALAGVVGAVVAPSAFAVDVNRSVGAVILAGLLVGFGTRLGSGCTSGHGVCGITRFSPRSIVATVTFITAGAVTVVCVRQLFGGTL